MQNTCSSFAGRLFPFVQHQLSSAFSGTEVQRLQTPMPGKRLSPRDPAGRQAVAASCSRPACDTAPCHAGLLTPHWRSPCAALPTAERGREVLSGPRPGLRSGSRRGRAAGHPHSHRSHLRRRRPGGSSGASETSPLHSAAAARGAACAQGSPPAGTGGAPATGRGRPPRPPGLGSPTGAPPPQPRARPRRRLSSQP